MYDEHIQRSARRLGVRPITFPHPIEGEVHKVLAADADRARSVILTGTAGDGKSRLCAHAWTLIGGDEEVWAADEVYYETVANVAGRQRTVGVIRDLTKLRGGSFGSYASRGELLLEISRAMFSSDPDRIFLVAANDGQLMETWRRLEDADGIRAHRVLENLLVGEPDPAAAGLAFFNLSVIPGADILDLALETILSHEGWKAAYEDATEFGFFGPECPIRRNYETLGQPLFRTRLRELVELLDHSGLHVPIRRVLLLLANILLGHPGARDRLLVPADVPTMIAEGTAHRSDIYDNAFGENLTPARRDGLEIMEFLSRFGIGGETTNRIDNILLFGSEDDVLHDYFQLLVEQDASPRRLAELRTARAAYLESPDAEADGGHPFLATLASQRRAMFFRIPDKMTEEMSPWSLSVFSRAGEYLRELVEPLRRESRVPRRILSGLVNGLNRVFTGMLVTTERELLLATNLSYTGAGVSQLLEERLSVAPKRHERVDIVLEGDQAVLVVQLDQDVRCRLPPEPSPL
ncbi:hypothetical protein KRR38_01455 [Novosphingobium sp. G106]|uniref:hypothetical protein n=1 Tax=Novosphingobium sp. G106 TaxID=2849500 RepID=UPI001C2D537F|nr:hypothetical protein [Novosphingobium sp. G106]MBV1686371.1 hypothetical protein [Novosphingobium sp. G106]